MDLSTHSHWIVTQELYFWLFNAPVTDRHNNRLQYLKRASIVQTFTQLRKSNLNSFGEALADIKIKSLANAMVCCATIWELLAKKEKWRTVLCLKITNLKSLLMISGVLGVKMKESWGKDFRSAIQNTKICKHGSLVFGHWSVFFSKYC